MSESFGSREGLDVSRDTQYGKEMQGRFICYCFLSVEQKSGKCVRGKSRLVNGTSDVLQVNGGVNEGEVEGRKKKEDEIKQYECEG